MKAKKSLLLILIIFLFSILLFTFIGCDEKQESGIQYNDKVEGRYSDGMRIVNTYAAPNYATEYLEEDRVDKVMYVDNRVKGLHFTGLYLPKGETITVNIGSTIISQRHKLVINSDQEDEEIIELNSTSITKSVDRGSRIDIWVDTSISEYHAFEITLKGCVEMPYYRLGVDKHKVEASSGFAVLDCANARFILPANILNNVTNIDDTLRWWRSSIEIMNRITDVGLQNGDLAPINIYVNERYDTNTWAISDKYIKIKESNFIDMLNYDKLANGSGKTLLDLLGGLIAKRSNGYDVGILKDVFGSVISDMAYIVMTDNIKDIDTVNKANAGEYLQSVIDGVSTDSKAQIFYNEILHSFGINSTIKILQEYKYSMIKNQENPIEQYLIDISKILKYDLSDFSAYLGYEVSDNIKNQLKDLPKFIPVQTKYTAGGVENEYQTGIVLPYGQKSTLNFGSAIISYEDGWKVIDVNGSPSWKFVSDGVYDYYPSSDMLEDNFQVKLEKDGQEKVLFGHISINIKVASYSVYQDTSFRDVDKAIKGVKDDTPTDSFSVYKAEVIQEQNEDENVYSFAVTKGSMQVEEDGKYTLYLKSKGLVKIKFGVTEYMFDLMSNQLTVTDYTEELKYEIELEADKVYNFEIYVLSTQGGGWATLGIKNKDGIVVDIDDDYIVYQDMNRDQIVKYQAPVLDIDSFKVQQKDYSHHLTKNWQLKDKYQLEKNSKEEYLFDDNKTTYYEIAKEFDKYELIVDMGNKFKAEYILLSTKVDMLGIDLKIEWSNDLESYNELFTGKIDSIDNLIVFEEKNINCQYIKITLSSPKEFKCSIAQISLGRIMKESIIIPNTSTKISYQGEWHEVNNYASVNGSITVNNDKNSTIEYEFYGSMISVYATKDKDFGMMQVYIDNKEVAKVNLYDTSTKCAEKVFTKEFTEIGLHKIKLVPQDKKDVINLDYLTSIEEPRPVAEKNDFNYWYIMIIPGVLLVGLFGFIIADIVTKKKGRKVIKKDEHQNKNKE